MWNSIQNGPYQRPMILNPYNTHQPLLEPLSRMTEVDACKNAKELWEIIKRLMFGFDVTNHVRHSRLMDEFDKFAAKEGESLESIYERKCDKSNQIVQHVQRTPNPSKANVQRYNCNKKGHYARDCQKPKVRNAKYLREQMLLAMKDEAGSHLSNEENDFMLDTAYGEESLDELTATVMLMARLQPADGNTDTVPSYDETAVSLVNDSSKTHKQVSNGKRKTIIQTTDDDQIDSSIIFDDPYVANNGGTSKHDSIAHEEYHEIQLLAYNVQREAENKKCLNNELKQQKNLLQQELETFEDRVKTFESQTVKCSKYKATCDDLEHELRNDKDTIDRLLKEKDKIQSDCFKTENEKLIIQHETQLAKKAFQEREN
ncbi:putative ribonuclease H-like domain-containing protein [Tanacetum coccineum]